MVFDTFSIARKRYRMGRTLRFGALVLAMIAFVTEAYEVWSALRSPSFMAALLDMRGKEMAAAFATGALALTIAQRWLVKWLVPMPRPGCHVCGYDTTGVRDGVCPECTAPTSPVSTTPPSTAP